MRSGREMVLAAEQRMLDWILRTATGITLSIEIGRDRVSIEMKVRVPRPGSSVKKDE